MAVKQLPKISDLPEPPDRLVGDQERFDVLTFNSLKAQKKMVNEDLNKTLIPALNAFAVDVNASVDAAKASETSALASKNSAASSAGTATTKAGEAAASAKAAKTSETSALASKNAASSSATAAANAQKAAEAARDEAQDLANVGYAAENHAGLAKVDGKTTQADAGGVITVKDVAIGGDLEDLASARGIFDTLTKGSVDCNTLTDQGVYAISLAETVNGPGFSAKLIVFNGKNSKFTNQMALAAGAGTSGAVRVAYRAKNSEDIWSPWSEGILSGRIGDGITVNNGIISAPEYEGATASTAGTSGLVPPATAGQQESFLTGGGEYKPALTKISDSVSLADSTTAASAKAVKTAYDLANGKQANLGFTPVQQGGGANQRPNKVYLGWDGGAVRMQVDNTDMGQLVTTLAGQQKAPNAAWADGAQFALRLRREGNVDTIWNWAGQGGQPSHVWGSNDGTNMLAWNPANFSVNYANSANYANGAEYANNAGSVVGTPNINVNNNGFNTLPPGGTWRLIQSDGSGFLQIKGEYAGGTYVGYSKFMYIRIA
ncbi:phage tail protein [Bilophila wadsworthia]|uniref:phage tail protein n=1 Tax=Bilophila wadsworthia TaxID=35833 RepID=UPI003AAF017E